MKTVGAIIREARAGAGLTLRALAEMVGCTKGYLSAIENERREYPPSDELLSKLEWALRLVPGELMRSAEWQSTPVEVKRRVRDLETSREATRRILRTLGQGAGGLDGALRSGELQKLVGALEGDDEEGGSASGGAGEGIRMMPVRTYLPLQVPLINKVAAGYPTEFTDLSYPARVADEYVSVPDVSDPDAFAARVVGSSMEPEYREGDIVVFSPAVTIKSGMDCFVRFERDAESTFKRVFFEDDGDGSGSKLRLQPLNLLYASRVVDREDVGGMYAAVCVVRPLGGAGVRSAMGR